MAEEAQTPSGADAPQMTAEEEREAVKAANRFDIRRLIGGLFVLYGLVLTVVGLVGSAHVKHFAAGININLWTGLGMIVFGALMIYWAIARPVTPDVVRAGRASEAPTH